MAMRLRRGYTSALVYSLCAGALAGACGGSPETKEDPGVGSGGSTSGGSSSASGGTVVIDGTAARGGDADVDPHAGQDLVIGLDARQRVRMLRTVGVGTLNRVEVHPREVFRPLLRAGMHSCLIAHNHPRGDATPSEADVLLTERMVGVGQFLGVPVVDHIVVSDHGFVSMAELGLIPAETEHV